MTEQTKAAISFSLIVGLGVALMLSLCWKYEEEPTKTIRVMATFEDLLDAIEWVESKGDANAVGDNGNAIGSFQIWKIYVDDCNRIIRETYFNYHDRWSKIQSRHMVITYLNYYGKGRNLEDMARIHNGGPNGYKKESTKKYWVKIKQALKEAGEPK